MEFSVLLPTYNSERIVGATIASVLSQTKPPLEVLVVDDGSTDNTVEFLRKFEPKIKIFQQKNRGVAEARNTLAHHAKGDILAFIDHDDLWHPRYLEVQNRLNERCPSAVASFTGHVNFRGYEEYNWNSVDRDGKLKEDEKELIEPLEFLRRYNRTTGIFGSMSFCCFPKRMLSLLGDRPFRVSGVDDSFLCTTFPLLGPVAYCPAERVAYRIIQDGQSANRLKSMGLWVSVFELLSEKYAQSPDPALRRDFLLAFEAKRRRFGKILMGVGETGRARSEFWKAMTISRDPRSFLKSFSFWIATRVPKSFQPKWPSWDRDSELAQVRN